jgi:tetratricopeptide (TPR) repeat protein
MPSSITAERLEKTSRVSTILMILGASLIFFALWSSYEKLRAQRNEVSSLQLEAAQLRVENVDLNKKAEGMRNKIKGIREALTESSDAIIAFHQHDYAAAVELYGKALQADPDNAYLLNLKAYSLFKLNNIDAAIGAQNESIRIEPEYAWGYFDLARFQCAGGDFDGARKSIEIATAKDPALNSTIQSDGEFQRLCAKILHKEN